MNITIYEFINIFTEKVLRSIIYAYELVFRLHIYQFYTNLLISLVCMCKLVLAVGNNYFYLHVLISFFVINTFFNLSVVLVLCVTSS